MSEAKTVITIAMTGESRSVDLGMNLFTNECEKNVALFHLTTSISSGPEGQKNVQRLTFDFGGVSFQLLNLNDPGFRKKDFALHAVIPVESINDNDSGAPLAEENENVTYEGEATKTRIVVLNDPNLLKKIASRLWDVVIASPNCISDEEKRNFQKFFLESFSDKKHQSRTRAPLFVGMVLSSIAAIVGFIVLATLGVIATPFLAIPIFFSVLAVVLAVKVAVNKVLSSGKEGEQNQDERKERDGIVQANAQTTTNNEFGSGPVGAKPQGASSNPDSENEELIENFKKLAKSKGVDLQDFTLSLTEDGPVYLKICTTTKDFTKTKIPELIKTLNAAFPNPAASTEGAYFFQGASFGNVDPKISIELPELKEIIAQNPLSKNNDLGF